MATIQKFLKYLREFKPEEDIRRRSSRRKKGSSDLGSEDPVKGNWISGIGGDIYNRLGRKIGDAFGKK